MIHSFLSHSINPNPLLQTVKETTIFKNNNNNNNNNNKKEKIAFCHICWMSFFIPKIWNWFNFSLSILFKKKNRFWSIKFLKQNNLVPFYFPFCSFHLWNDETLLYSRGQDWTNLIFKGSNWYEQYLRDQKSKQPYILIRPKLQFTNVLANTTSTILSSNCSLARQMKGLNYSTFEI